MGIQVKHKGSKRMHEGHRQRMLERLQQGGAMQDHEMLEVLLFNAIPRKNTNELSHRLLQAFGSLYGVLTAPMNALMRVEGIGSSAAGYLRTVGLVLSRVETSHRSDGPTFNNMHDFSEFVKIRFQGVKEEFIELFCLDAAGRLTFCQRYGSGEKNVVTIPAEEINRFLVEHKPSRLVVAHNHPNGPAKPSAQDDSFTALMQMVCSVNNVFFGDHVIVAGEELYSYFFVGRMEEIHKSFKFSNIIDKKGGKA